MAHGLRLAFDDARPFVRKFQQDRDNMPGARLGLCVTEVAVTNRTVKNTHFLRNRAISEIRLP